MAERITEKSAIEKQIIKGILGLKYHHGEYDLKSCKKQKPHHTQ